MGWNGWKILGGVLVGGFGGIATAVLLMTYVQPDSIPGFIIAGAIVLIFTLVLMFFRLRTQVPRA
jgi:hypothetical protein